jgi:hypothetical protein
MCRNHGDYRIVKNLCWRSGKSNGYWCDHYNEIFIRVTKINVCREIEMVSSQKCKACHCCGRSLPLTLGSPVSAVTTSGLTSLGGGTCT